MTIESFPLFIEEVPPCINSQHHRYIHDSITINSSNLVKNTISTGVFAFIARWRRLDPRFSQEMLLIESFPYVKPDWFRFVGEESG